MGDQNIVQIKLILQTIESHQSLYKGKKQM
jgi:hypothetical protein